ncbi:hypothetical protein GQ53DRAFT_636393 [Thozetella sp. PMI_491]|nr:hypothetical protein GQ53DRAFT_636393 [Thozetella sp. PMI_491]
MFIRDLTRLSLVIAPLLLLLLLVVGYWERSQQEPARVQLGKWWPSQPPKLTDQAPGSLKAPSTHHELVSLSTADGRFFDIQLNGTQSFNPNIIPHPIHNDTWIVVAQRNKTSIPYLPWNVEVGCNAVFADGALRCLEAPDVLPIAATFSDHCAGELALMTLNIGPHDARVFFGPKTPFITYGSNSEYTCFGQWVQDFRVLTAWGLAHFQKDGFRSGTEIQRPPPYSPVEKNFFLFWDRDDQVYAHYDMAPRRAFSMLLPDGSVGPDLSRDAALLDDQCMAKRMPKVETIYQSIHQATNSLSVTLCKRADPACRPSEANTFVFHIFQLKEFFNFRGRYEPYVVLFQQRAPFEMYAVSDKPLWIHGRQRWNETHSDMFYVVSMSWKAKNQTYHGYLDDVLFLSFGIEDYRPAGIDVRASDLLANLGLCAESLAPAPSGIPPPP